MCGATGVPVAPFYYCYACFSRFGSLAQTMLMLLCFNPYLSREGAIEALGSYRDVSASLIGLEWDIVHQISLLKNAFTKLISKKECPPTCS